MTKQPERKPSEIIKDFIDLIAQSHEEYETNMSIAKGFDKKTITWIHDFEVANNYDERCKLATALHQEREFADSTKTERSCFRKSMSLQDRNVISRF